MLHQSILIDFIANECSYKGDSWRTVCAVYVHTLQHEQKVGEGGGNSEEDILPFEMDDTQGVFTSQSIKMSQMWGGDIDAMAVF